MYALQDYQYVLPVDRIAQLPTEPADHSKLLVWRKDDTRDDTHFFSLPTLLPENAVLFLNDTRVVQARMIFSSVRVVTKQGRHVQLPMAEIFFLHKHDEYTCEALITLLKRNRPGTRIFIQEDPCITLTITALTAKGVLLHSEGMSIDELLHHFGTIPLPPYITPTARGEEQYQTCFAKHAGSVAAPTASLHMTPDLLERLTQKGIDTYFVTLHVGLGTFKPVDTADIRDYAIHEEMIQIEKHLFIAMAHMLQSGKKSVAVGTTVARLLETLPYARVILKHMLYTTDFPQNVQEFWDMCTADISHEHAQKYIVSCTAGPADTYTIWTKIFIYPGFQWRIVRSLITNFHVPGSSLLMLVAAAMGYDHMRQAYAHAIQHNYMFFSFGDSMMIDIIR